MPKRPPSPAGGPQSFEKITDLGFSYSPRGELADAWQRSTNSAGWYHVSGAYWPTGPTGLLNTLTVPGLPLLTYNPDGEGRIGKVLAGSAYLANSTQYNNFQSGWRPMVVNLGATGRLIQLPSVLEELRFQVPPVLSGSRSIHKAKMLGASFNMRTATLARFLCRHYAGFWSRFWRRSVHNRQLERLP